MSTICERGRRILPWIIERANSGDEFAAFDVTSRSTLHAELWDAVHDPAKLADTMAEEGRRLGLDAAWSTDSIGSVWGRVEFVAFDDCIVFRVPSSVGKFIFSRRLPAVRAILAELLQLPNDAHKEAERVLRGET